MPNPSMICCFKPVTVPCSPLHDSCKWTCRYLPCCLLCLHPSQPSPILGNTSPTQLLSSLLSGSISAPLCHAPCCPTECCLLTLVFSRRWRSPCPQTRPVSVTIVSPVLALLSPRTSRKDSVLPDMTFQSVCTPGAMSRRKLITE